MSERITATTKYAKLTELLRERIKSGEYAPGLPLPTQRTLMDRHRLSFSTVKRALDEIIREGLVYPVQGKGIFVVDPQKMTTDRKLVFNLFGEDPEWMTDMPTGWVAGLLSAQHELDFLMEVTPRGSASTVEQRLLDGTETADGTVFLCLAGRMPLVRAMERVGHPYVALDVPSLRTGVNCVIIDHEAGAHEVVTHLIDRGHRSIACIGGRTGEGEAWAWSTAKLAGYRRAMREAGLEVRPEDVIQCDDWNIGDDSSCAERIVKEYILPRRGEVTAAFISIERLAWAMLEQLSEIGMSIPGDIAVAGFNDQCGPEDGKRRLTTIRVPMAEAAREGVRMLVAQIEGRERFPQQKVLHGDLIVRESSGG